MRVERDKSKAGSHPPPARRASIHVALNVNRTDREGERESGPNQSRFVRQSPTDKSRTRRARVIRLFTYFRVVIGRLPPLTLSPILSLSFSCGEKAALRSSPASLSPWHVFPSSAPLPLFSPSFPVIHPLAGRLSIRTFQHQLPRGRWLCLCSGK